MEALLASVTQPAKLSGIWDNPAWRDYAKDLKADMAGYSAKDLEYWKLMAAAHPAMTKARKAEIEHLEHEEHLHHAEPRARLGEVLREEAVRPGAPGDREGTRRNWPC